MDTYASPHCRTLWRKCPFVSRNVLWCVWFARQISFAHALALPSLAIPGLTWFIQVFYGHCATFWPTVGPHCPTTYRYTFGARPVCPASLSSSCRYSCGQLQITVRPTPTLHPRWHSDLLLCNAPPWLYSTRRVYIFNLRLAFCACLQLSAFCVLTYRTYGRTMPLQFTSLSLLSIV